MTRQWLATGAALVALSGVLAACSGGSDEPKADPTKAATSAAPATTTPAPAPTPAAQPQGANGVTYEIQNWDEYATDPAVLAWKQTLEAVGGSANSGKVLEPVRTGTSKKVLRTFVSSLQQAKSGNWHVEPVGKVRIEAAETTSNRSKLTVCTWGPSTVYLTKDGKSPDGDENFDVWFKQTFELALRDGRWKITAAASDGKCSGGAPA